MPRRPRDGSRASTSSSSTSRGTTRSPSSTLWMPTAIPIPTSSGLLHRHSFSSLRNRGRAEATDKYHFSDVSEDSDNDGLLDDIPSPQLTRPLLERRRGRPSPITIDSPGTPPMTYASLPPSPISPTPPKPFARPPSPPKAPVQLYQRPFSLWDYLKEELLTTDHDSHQELKWERVSNFLSIPFAIEKILAFGFVLCFDSLLHTFTILPIRFGIACCSSIGNIFGRSKVSMPPSQKADILRTLLLVVSIMILVPLTNASRIYHSIRGQDTIKLYVIFNALEVADRLCSSFGQDITDCLFSRSTLQLLSWPWHRKPTWETFRPFIYFAISTIYVVSHTLVLVYQLTALNVAINSYDQALSTLLVSNQFVEIKGSVFKKFEKDNLFQITCADIVERFTLSLMLFAVVIRNLVEIAGSEFDFSEGVDLPKSFGWFKGGNLAWVILSPALTVLFSELVVDWMKHAFITKFNHVRPSVYERYTDVLCLDLSNGSTIGRRSARKHSYVDQSPIVARRLGFPAMPLAVLTALLGAQSFSLVVSSLSSPRSPAHDAFTTNAKWITLGLLLWVCLVVVKIIMGVNLVSYASWRRLSMEAREREDKVNDFGRDPIGEGREEREYNRGLKEFVNNKLDDATPAAELGENPPPGARSAQGREEGGGSKANKRPKLEELTRFTMVKRIW